MNDWAGIAWLVVLLVANAFFVGAEFAVISARRSQIEPLAEKGSRSAKTALWAMEHATLMLATCQLGITICSLLILNVSEPAIHHLLAVPLEAIGLPYAVVDVTGFVIALLLVSYLHVVFGEMVPKNLAFSLPDRAVLMLAPPLVFVSRVFHPIIVALNWIANHIVRLFRVEPKDEAASTFTLDEVATIVNQSRMEGLLDDASGAVAMAVEFTDKKAKDVAVPLSELVTLPESTTPDEIERAVARHGFSRYVIVDDEGMPLGYVHLKDVLRAAEGEGSEDTVARPIKPKRIHHMIPIGETTDLEDALALMRRSSRHLAQVRDSAGETTAVLFLEDIIEELVGEVHDATRRR
ncbi:hemolysin family protein [Microbacterium sp. EYE_5]|uniref:hemolysin family protein n=1 Tax=unclassified Microbacterium TaxID=2609290 RepID=UPI0020047B2E|nr:MULTISPECIES: hemolysin family protein [unclassified Microbacterium]MCK6081463.1 hemolysin family protein [Microbacterium sp. EYE_382]MCK6086733.1 hemolysin family protein [Microbacterium sp. EYE_384]MCK6123769.1 hemolysin family protein [Microbacterium sp. EYE_80]MCK6126678.1 hemolysin family protein [Microbacterium sp. EYE_79]MCK6142418.1 hemolysin family protein [Microbacterium sp. EYE_39]